MNRFVISALLLVTSVAASAQTKLNGAGATFPYPIYSKWFAEYNKLHPDVEINYQSIGSGGGIRQVSTGTVDFGASDGPMSDQQLSDAKTKIVHIPTVLGAVVPAYNIAEVKQELNFSPQTLAKIFLGQITNWSDPAIAALNPDIALPSAKITVVHRSDGSGTTFNFSNYLSKVSPGWKSRVGEGTAVNWPTGIGGKGNEGVSAYVKQIPNSIGYVEYAYAVQNKLGYARMKNAAGKVVSPGSASFQAAAANADWSHARNFNLLMTNAPGADAWPITATSWVIMVKQPKNAANSKVALDFFRYAYSDGKSAAAALDYVPLPTSLVNRIEGYWKTEFKH